MQIYVVYVYTFIYYVYARISVTFHVHICRYVDIYIVSVYTFLSRTDHPSNFGQERAFPRHMAVFSDSLSWSMKTRGNCGGPRRPRGTARGAVYKREKPPGLERVEDGKVGLPEPAHVSSS